MAEHCLRTPLCDLLGIKHPVMLAGMAGVSNGELAAAVSNAGGIGTIGGILMTPKALRTEIQFLKDELEPGLPFGVDLALPQIGGSARKTNKDYTKGKLEEIVDILVEEKPRLFVTAVGVPPKWVVDRLHANGIIVANMIGSPSHIQKCLAVGVDFLIAQGTEAGGHTGEIATMPLIPQCVDAVKGKTNYFGSPVLVVAAGGIFDGRGLSAALCLGAAGVWVGTRFIAAEESGGNKLLIDRVVKATSNDTARTTAFTGRPVRMFKSPYVQGYLDKDDEVKRMNAEGKIPHVIKVRAGEANTSEFYTAVFGQAAGGIHDIKPARAIVEEMVRDAVAHIQTVGALQSRL